MVGDYRADGGPLAAGPAITSTVGDERFDRLIGERRYQDIALKPASRFHRRPEPLPVPRRRVEPNGHRRGAA